ncbi:hypothetical protein BH09SUM1_BH09SUM1_07600 [soil metagenome]
MAEGSPESGADKDDELLPVRSAESWEQVLTRARDAPPLTGELMKPAGPPRRDYAALFKMLFPVLILAFYGIYKLTGADFSHAKGWSEGVPRDRASITGIAPPKAEGLKLSTAAREFVSVLESRAERSEWRQIVDLTDAQSDLAIRDHPVVQALSAIARTRLAERTIDLERKLDDLIKTLQPVESTYPDLLQELRTARVDQLVSRMPSAELLTRNTDLLTQLLGDRAESGYEVQVRQKLARIFESTGDEYVESAKGLVRTDAIALAEGRGYYQRALRWIVEKDEWLALAPITPGAAPDVQRIVEKLRQANRLQHGMSMPFSDSDPFTWSGRKNTPVHDNGTVR